MTEAHTKLTSATRLAVVLIVSTTSTFAGSIIAGGVLAPNGGTGAISFGVAPPRRGPECWRTHLYIGDNVTGFNDILSSPGLGTLGGYLTASPVLANNIASYGGALPLYAVQVGGGNGAGAFGSGAAENLGSAMGFALADSGAGGGSASYLISAANYSFTDVGARPLRRDRPSALIWRLAASFLWWAMRMLPR